MMRFAPGELPFPMPWAVDAGMSFVATPEDYAAAARAAGFREVDRHGRRDGAVAAVEGQRRGRPGTPMEARFANPIAGLRAGTLAPVVMILRRE